MKGRISSIQNKSAIKLLNVVFQLYFRMEENILFRMSYVITNINVMTVIVFEYIRIYSFKDILNKCINTKFHYDLFTNV